MLILSYSISVRYQYLRLLAVAYEKTQELARDLCGVGCGDLDVEGKGLKFHSSFPPLGLKFVPI